MSRLPFSIIVLLCLILLCLVEVDYLYKNNYPKISLPEKAHHTIGQIPIVEHLDDGQVTINNNIMRSAPVEMLCTTGAFVIYQGRRIISRVSQETTPVQVEITNNWGDN